MKRAAFSYLAMPLALLAAAPLLAETSYISDQLQIGLHEEKNLDSPIIKTLPSGTALELIKQEENVSFVRDPQGASGWIDNSYLMNSDPDNDQLRAAREQISALQSRLDTAQQEISSLQGRAADAAAVQALRQEKTAIEARLKAEKLKAGQLEAEISRLRKRVGMSNDKQSLYEQIEALEADKKNLEVALAISRGDGEGALSARLGSEARGWRALAIYLVISMLIGLGLGVYFMDLLNRRRHGGFRT